MSVKQKPYQENEYDTFSNFCSW